jgi:poly(A) polymerase
MDQVLDTQTEKLAIPRRLTADMKELWALQLRLEQRSGRKPFRVLEHPRFRAAYDFLQLRCDSGELEPAIGDWWRHFQQASGAEREGMLVQSREPGRRRSRGRRRRSAARNASPAPSEPVA